MAGKPIEIKIDIDSSAAEKGVENITDALEEVSDSLKDVNKAGEKTGKDLESDMSDAAKKIDRDLTKALDEVEDKAKSTGKSIGKSVKDGADKAGEGLSELKDESASTAKEAAASFGSIEDAADALQEVAANAFVGFGPAGMAAGLVAAAGIGLAISALTDNADKINENKEKMLSLAQTIKENGGVLGEADYIRQMEEYGYAIQDTKEWFEIFQQDAISGFDKLKKIQDETSLSATDLFKGMFGNKDEAVRTLDEVNRQIAELEEKQRAIYELDGSIMDPVDSNTLASLKEAKTGIEDNIKAQEAAIQVEKTRKDAIAGTTQELLENIEAQEKAADSIKNSLSAEMDYLDGVDQLNAKLAENGATLDINTAKGRENQRAVLDQASAIEEQARASIEAGESADVVTAKFQAQRDTLVNQVMPAFGGSREQAEAFINTILKTPKQTVTNVIVNDQEARNKLDDLTKARTAPLHIQPDGTAVENWFYSQQGRKIFVDFAPRGGGQAIAQP